MSQHPPIPTTPVAAPVTDRRIEKLVAALRLERPLAALPRPLRFAVARKRFGWIDPLAALQHGFEDRRSLIETDRLNTIFIHIPKAAGLSVAESLFDSHAASHVPLYQFLPLYGARAFDGKFKFTFVRHPVDRVASAYHFLKGGGMTDTDRDWAEAHLAPYQSLDHFLTEGLPQPHIQDWVHFKPQVFWLRDPRTGRIGVDFLGRFESINEDFAHIARTLGVDAQLKHINKSQRKEIILSPEARAVLDRVYAEDFDILGYDRPA